MALEWAAGFAIPNDDRFSLIRDANSLDIFPFSPGAFQSGINRLILRFPDLSASCSTQPGWGNI